MDYFTDVYLKRVNRFGSTIQSRIHGKMRNDFENKLKKSVNKVDLYSYTNENKKINVGIFETKKINETEVINFLCTRIDDIYENGFVFYTNKPFSKQKQAWMILYKEQYQTIGYNRYIIILLENKLNLIGSDGLIHSSFVHYVGSKETKVKDLFRINYDVALGLPGKTLSIICPYNENLKRDLRINISNETWCISSYDKVSVPGIMYITLEEDYLQKTEYANQQENDKWTIISSQGYDLVISQNSSQNIDFYCSFNGVLVDENIELQCNDPQLKMVKTGFNQYRFNGEPNDYLITGKLRNNGLVQQQFSLTITENQENWMAIIGPKQIKVLQIAEYELATSLMDYAVDISSEKGCFIIDKIEGNKIYIKGNNIGQDNIVITYEGNKYLTPINVISPWM